MKDYREALGDQLEQMARDQEEAERRRRMPMTRLQRAIRRTIMKLERQGMPQPWLVDLRIHQNGTLAAIHPQIVSLGAMAADWHPPAVGPEIEVTLEIWATTGEIAERQARRRADGQGLQVLASRFRPATSAPDAKAQRAAAEADPRWGAH